MSEKIIKGVIERFSKIEVGTKNDEAKTPYAFVDIYFLDNEYPNKFFFDTPEEAKEKLFDKVPIGSTIEFKIWKKEDSKYWNVDMKSFTVLFEGDGTVPKSQKDKDPSSNVLFVRQNALRHADEWIKTIFTNTTPLEDTEKEYFRFAEKCEEWIMRE